jgi:hypothetical protein
MNTPLPKQLLPELRGRWVKYIGSREAVQAAANVMRQHEASYQDLLNTALRLVDLDPATNWKVNLETGEVSEVTAADVVRQDGGVPFVAPTVDSSN